MTATTPSPARNWIARASAVTIIVVMGFGLTTVYGELMEERAAGVKRTQLLEQLQRDNAQLSRDNDQLRLLIQKQNELIKDLADRPNTITRERIREVTQLPPELFPPRGNGGGTGGKPDPKPTVKPTPKPPAPAPTSTPLVCVPLVNICL